MKWRFVTNRNRGYISLTIEIRRRYKPLGVMIHHHIEYLTHLGTTVHNTVWPKVVILLIENLTMVLVQQSIELPTGAAHYSTPWVGSRLPRQNLGQELIISIIGRKGGLGEPGRSWGPAVIQASPKMPEWFRNQLTPRSLLDPQGFITSSQALRLVIEAKWPPSSKVSMVHVYYLPGHWIRAVHFLLFTQSTHVEKQ